ncbi:PAS domain-containing protein [Aerophototrophica crusticola]|uniref:PAS domain-containing protein n=1 Tax=Aerophototrophica crusticola TaxID=1709002 RepID=A0A858R679_9PROT|nr:PAS domain-containing protein [Rhodospirillaceae bacterium B3]
MLPQLQSLLSFWESLRKGRELPSRQDFRPEDLGPWMGHLGLVAVEHGGRFRVRLSGTTIVEYDGEDFTGRYLDEAVPPAAYQEILRPYRQVLETRQPVHSSYVSRLGPSASATLERLLLPFSDDGCRVDLIMAGIYAVTDEPLSLLHSDLYGRPRLRG